MISLDEQITVAEQLAHHLGGVERNEWLRWAQLAVDTGLDEAVAAAKRMSADPSLRDNIQRANQAIHAAVTSARQRLARLTPSERQAVFGYVGWLLAIASSRRQRKRQSGRCATSEN
jgi:predicted acyl esterase